MLPTTSTAEFRPVTLSTIPMSERVAVSSVRISSSSRNGLLDPTKSLFAVADRMTMTIASSMSHGRSLQDREDR